MDDKNKYRLTARVIVKNGNEVLFLRRSQTDPSRPGVYDIPGGLVEEGESLEQAAKRELKEEAGIDVSDLKFLQTSSYEADGENRLSGMFEANITTKNVVLSAEHDQFQWLNASNFNNYNLDPYYKKFFVDYFQTDEDEPEPEQKVSENTTIEHLIAYTDGGSRGNPGPSASGYVLMNEEEEVLEEGGEYLGVTTNNQAEYQAVKLALQKAKKYRPKEISFYIDSLLVVNQLIGKFKIKAKDLWPINEDIKKLASEFNKVTYTHVKREFNTLADEQVNIVLDSYEHRGGK